MTDFQKLECSIILIDLSGFTQLLYHASYQEQIMSLVIKAMQKMFKKSIEATEIHQDVHIINTTGDGFFAIAQGKTPSRTAVLFAQEIRRQFTKQVKSIIYSVPFRQRVDLRIALHHGVTYKIDIPWSEDENYPIFIGDDLNLLARVINSQTARRFTFAITKAFYVRLMLGKKDVPDEVILDRNRYPEQIEVYRMPEEIPEYKPKKKKE